MKTKLLYGIIILSLAVVLTGFSSVEESYLPTAILISRPGKFDKELLLNLRASLANHKVKTISKEDAMELQKQEIERVLRPFYENLKMTGNPLKHEEVQAYMSLNQRKVCNSLTIDINVSDDGVIQDTIKWLSRTLPFDFSDSKKEWTILVLKPGQKTSVIAITQTIADSIIRSNVLVKGPFVK